MSRYISLNRLGPIGGTGRRARLKIVFRKKFQFESEIGHQRLLLKQSLHIEPVLVFPGSSSLVIVVCISFISSQFKHLSIRAAGPRTNGSTSFFNKIKYLRDLVSIFFSFGSFRFIVVNIQC